MSNTPIDVLIARLATELELADLAFQRVQKTVKQIREASQ